MRNTKANADPIERAAQDTRPGRRPAVMPRIGRGLAIAVLVAGAVLALGRSATAQRGAAREPNQDREANQRPGEHSPAGQHESDAAQTEHALQLFREAADHYRAGRFAVAVALLRESYQLSPQTETLYNIARALEGMGQLEEAAETYQRYLDEAPDTDIAGAVRRRLTTLRRLHAQTNRDEEPEPLPDLPPPPPTPESDGGLSPVPFVLAGIGVAGLVAAGVLTALAVGEHDASQEVGISHQLTVERFDRAETLALGGNIAFAVGGSFLLAGMVGFLIDVMSRPSTEEEAPQAVTFQLGPAGGALRVRF